MLSTGDHHHLAALIFRTSIDFSVPALVTRQRAFVRTNKRVEARKLISGIVAEPLKSRLRWLREIGLEQYAQTFRDNAINADVDQCVAALESQSMPDPCHRWRADETHAVYDLIKTFRRTTSIAHLVPSPKTLP
jgi:hypothetical protein